MVFCDLLFVSLRGSLSELAFRIKVFGVHTSIKITSPTDPDVAKP